MTFLWTTRGRRWGYRFLRDGGLADPLPTFEDAFANMNDAENGWCEHNGAVALRFEDPEGRRDESGRPILHEFVLLPPVSDGIGSLEDGIAAIWPLVADEYARTWDNSPAGPTRRPDNG